LRSPSPDENPSFSFDYKRFTPEKQRLPQVLAGFFVKFQEEATDKQSFDKPPSSEISSFFKSRIHLLCSKRIIFR
jgi:hypothetical protein